MQSSDKQDLSDIHFTSWVDYALPKKIRPYARLARLDRPVGTWLTLLPCLAALVQASGRLPNLYHLVVFSLGALIMRSAGSTANDIADRKFDAHVERTRHRPLASGELTLKQGLVFLMLELLLAACLLIFLNPLSRWLALALIPIVFIYPLCKRFTYWPQVPLGIAFNWGMLMAWSDIKGFLTAGGIVMWLGAVCWQVGYDSIYAYVDIADDAKLKLRSTALFFAQKGRVWITLFYASTVLFWCWGGLLVGMRPAYFIGMVLIALHFAWQMRSFDVNQASNNMRLFKSNVIPGVILLMSSLTGVFFN